VLEAWQATGRLVHLSDVSMKFCAMRNLHTFCGGAIKGRRRVFGGSGGSCFRPSLVVLCATDPFADAAEADDSSSNKEYVHIRIQQRNGKKSLTTVQVIQRRSSFRSL
jgi:hypothetical protein